MGENYTNAKWHYKDSHANHTNSKQMLYDGDSAEQVHLLIKAEKNIEKEKEEAER